MKPVLLFTEPVLSPIAVLDHELSYDLSWKAVIKGYGLSFSWEDLLALRWQQLFWWVLSIKLREDKKYDAIKNY